MIATLDRKLLRDIWGMKGQFLAVSLVMACGVGIMIATHGIILSLESTRDAYYDRYRMPDVFGHVQTAPLSMVDRIGRIPGVTAVDLRVVRGAVLDMEGMDEPVRAKLVSIPNSGQQHLNQIFLRRGRLPEVGEQRGVVVSETFALAHNLNLGDRIVAIINGRRDHLDVCGIGLSPEFVFEAPPGQTLPDSRHYGVFWMRYEALATAYDLNGAFNDFCLDLAPGSAPEEVIEELDLMLQSYGATGAYEVKNHFSSRRLADELRIVQSLALAYPLIFLGVAAFMVNAVVMRLVRLQREQIAQLKALGYSSQQVGRHYLNYAFVIVVLGGVTGVLAGKHLGSMMLQVYTILFHFPSLSFQMDHAAMVGALVISVIAAVLGVAGAVWMAAKLSPAEAMRPEPPTDFKPSLLERLGVTRGSSLVFRMALRNIERRPAQAGFAVVGVALATGLLVLPGALADSVDYLLTYQWSDHFRHQVMIVTRETATNRTRYDFGHLPGVQRVEPFRGLSVRMSHGHHMRMLYVMGFPRDGSLVMPRDLEGRPIELPKDGMVISQKLGEVLEVKPGDKVMIQPLEGRCELREIHVSGVMADFYGLSAYMDIDSLQRHLRETDTMNGALVTVDTVHWDDFMTGVKEKPGIDTATVTKDQLQAFRASTGESIGLLRRLFLWMAVIVAFGVVYNSARIALSERGRDLATLRVVGMTRLEIAGVLLGELSILVLVALPLGLFFGHWVAKYVIAAVSTETVRLPSVIHPATYASSALIVLAAAGASFAFVARLLSRLDLVSVLKARD